MEIRNCRQCGRLYNYIGGTYRNLCPACVEKVEDKFGEVKKYIEENPNADIRTVSIDVDVSIKQLEKWIREERLSFSEDSPMGIGCEKCGKTIKTGRFCKECASKLEETLNGLYCGDIKQEKKSKDNRMRFIDR